jgi:hypothetical protein
MQITLDKKDTDVLVSVLTDEIDRMSVRLVEIRSEELKYARLTKERSYLIALRLRIFQAGPASDDNEA